MHVLLLVGATTQLINVRGGAAPQGAEVQGQPTTAELVRQHAASPEPATASHAATPAAGEPVVSSPVSLPSEVLLAAQLGELQNSSFCESIRMTLLVHTPPSAVLCRHMEWSVLLLVCFVFALDFLSPPPFSRFFLHFD